ncbi:TPA: hypothetical protein U1323_000871 [Streptococcus suis]|nr:hypothetical protein [Streptococcus suis]HEM5221009.1 hypothetical protein [Streptococcus suis]HEM5224056.1 hypothetical protein [Streptococcus suis]HEP1804293.1 hypothetical protein [Streptococcus suis]
MAKMKKSSYYDSRKIFWIAKIIEKLVLFRQFWGIFNDFFYRYWNGNAY